MKKNIIRLIISNGVALLVFYLMYRWGVENIQYVQQFYKIPLAAVLIYLAYTDFREIKVASIINK